MIEEVLFGKCPSCKGRCGLHEPLCAECAKTLKRITVRCAKCGFPMKDGSKCELCSGKVRFSGDSIYSYYDYSGAIREAILSLKFRYNVRLIWTLYRLFEHLPEGLNLSEYSAIVPVPSHFLRKFSRFYHPTDILARYLSNISHVPLLHALRRNRRTSFQYALSTSDRKKNVENAFSLRIQAVPKNILLVDDIFTTGSTLSACANTLKSAGAFHVDACTIAID